MEEKKEHELQHMHSHKKSLTEKIRENPWILSTLVCGVLSLVLLVSIFSGALTGSVISSKSAGEKILSFYESLGVQELSLGEIKEVSGLYEVNLIYKGNPVPIYLTKDGKNLIPGDAMSPLESTSSDSQNNNQQTEVPKSDKPEVELYVYTYCPYGLQMEKAIIPVVNLLKDNFNLKIRQIGAMHGDFEKVEAERQLCIEKNYPTKYLEYVLAFAEDTTIGECKGDAVCLAPKLKTLYTKFGIDSAKIDSCMKTDGEKLYNAEISNAQAKGVSGSPTLIVNGVDAQANRSPEVVKGVICAAFNNVPSECSTTLSNDQASAGFGAGSSSGASTASC